MMRLLCNNTYLDLYDNAGMQFTHTNPLFAFDDLKCERTTQFKLPTTPTNDAVLGLARVPAYAGTGMRQKFSAQLQMSAVVKNGYLYVAGFDGTDYNAIFVTGELLGLQAVKNAGKLHDILNCTGSDLVRTYGNSPTAYMSNSFARIAYKSNGLVNPSLRLYSVLKDALDALGVNYTLPTDYARIIPATARGIVSQGGAFSRTAYIPTTESGTIPVVATAVISGAYGLADVFGTATAGVSLNTVDNNNVSHVYKGKVTMLKPKQKISITFPDNWPNDVFIGRFVSQPDEYVPQLEIFSFLGERSFDTDGTITGESLRGRSVDIESGETFTFIDIDDWNAHYADSGQSGSGWTFGGGDWADIAFTIEGGEIAEGDTVRAQDQLPDLTVIDLLKTLAALHGKVLNYTEADGITFDDLNFASWAAIDIDGKVTKMGEVKRTFFNYAQRNTVSFESGGNVLDVEKIVTAYNIVNDNIENEKELQVIPFSEGGAEGARVYVRVDEDTFILADADTNDSFMHRVSLPVNAGLQALCTTSTQIKVNVHMYAVEYEQITPKTLLRLNGTKYAWTSRSWQDDEAQFTLARVA